MDEPRNKQQARLSLSTGSNDIIEDAVRGGKSKGAVAASRSGRYQPSPLLLKQQSTQKRGFLPSGAARARQALSFSNDKPLPRPSEALPESDPTMDSPEREQQAHMAYLQGEVASLSTRVDDGQRQLMEALQDRLKLLDALAKAHKDLESARSASSNTVSADIMRVALVNGITTSMGQGEKLMREIESLRAQLADQGQQAQQDLQRATETELSLRNQLQLMSEQVGKQGLLLQQAADATRMESLASVTRHKNEAIAAHLMADHLRQDLEELDGIRAALEEQLIDTSAQGAAAYTELATTEADLHASLEEAEGLRRELHAAQEQAAEVESQLHTARALHDAEMQVVESELERARGELAETHAELEQTAQKGAAVRAELSSTQQQLSVARAESARGRAALAELQTVRMQLEGTMAREALLATQVAAARKELAGAVAEANARVALETQLLRDSNARLQQQLREAVLAREVQDGQLLAAAGQASELEEARGAARAAHRAVAQAQGVAAEAERQLEALRFEITTAHNDADAARRTTAEAQQAVAARYEEVAELRQELEVAEALSVVAVHKMEEVAELMVSKRAAEEAEARARLDAATARAALGEALSNPRGGTALRMALMTGASGSPLGEGSCSPGSPATPSRPMLTPRAGGSCGGVAVGTEQVSLMLFRRKEQQLQTTRQQVLELEHQIEMQAKEQRLLQLQVRCNTQLREQVAELGAAAQAQAQLNAQAEARLKQEQEVIEQAPSPAKATQGAVGGRGKTSSNGAGKQKGRGRLLAVLMALSQQLVVCSALGVAAAAGAQHMGRRAEQQNKDFLPSGISSGVGEAAT